MNFKLIFLVSLALIALSGSSALASVKLFNPLSCNNIGICVCSLASALFAIAVPVVVVMVLVGGFQMLTAAGDPEKFRAGKNTIVYAVIGLSVIVLSRGIIITVYSILGGTGSVGC